MNLLNASQTKEKKLKESNEKPLLESKWTFHDQHEFDYFLESIQGYPKLRRFQEEWENTLRNWTKYDTFEQMIDAYKEIKPDFTNEDIIWMIKEEYYRIKQEWMDDRS